MTIINPYYEKVCNLKEYQKACEKLRRRNTKNLGFIPEKAYFEAIIRNRIRLWWEETYEEIVGFIYYGCKDEYTTIYQICVHEDFRRQGIAKELLLSVESDPTTTKTTHIKLRCREDIKGNAFWIATGFELIDQEDEENEAGKRMNCYIRERRRQNAIPVTL